MFKAFIILWILYALGVLAVIGGIVYVALHFLAKVW